MKKKSSGMDASVEFAVNCMLECSREARAYREAYEALVDGLVYEGLGVWSIHEPELHRIQSELNEKLRTNMKEKME